MTRQEPWFQDSRQEVREIVNRAVDGLEHHVLPLLRRDDQPSAVDHEGSAILVRFRGRPFIASAGHAIRACTHGLAVPDDQGQLVWLEGPFTLSAPPSGRTDDFLDLGVMELEPHQEARFVADRFLDLEPDALAPIASWVAPIVVVLGFPVRDTVDDPANSVLSGQLTQFGTGLLEEEDYARAQVDPRYHILLRLRRESIMTSRSIGSPPSWRGISGGGVWVVPIAPPDRSHGPAFAGVLLGRPPLHKKALKVTRVEALFHFMRLHC